MIKQTIEHSNFKLDDIIVESTEIDTVEDIQSEISVVENKFDQDFGEVRDNIKTLIQKGNDSVDEVLKLAKASDHPRAFEVAGNFLKQLTDMNLDVLDLYKKKKEILKKEIGSQEAGTINNTQNIVFQGSTYDFQKMLSNAELAKDANTFDSEQDIQEEQ